MIPQRHRCLYIRSNTFMVMKKTAEIIWSSSDVACDCFFAFCNRKEIKKTREPERRREDSLFSKKLQKRPQFAGEKHTFLPILRYITAVFQQASTAVCTFRSV